MLAGFKNLKPCRNVMMGNDVTLFKASTADVFLGGSCNIALQEKCSIVDKGQMNLVMK
jgi:hypothetical protein